MSAPGQVWISVCDEMPDDETTVLVHCLDDEPVWLGYKVGDEWRTVEGVLADVTHWMPLPVPPEVGT